ncbi:MAG: septum formation initiator family protein [Terracidiphilus sp.]
MQDGKTHTGKGAEEAAQVSLRQRAVDWGQHAWRPAGTAVAVALALLFGWGVVNGKHGLSAWEQQRTQDKQLRQQIQDLQQENARLRDHIEHLKSDPDAIEHEAREQLHYARPGEVIYTLPAQPQTQTLPAGNGK